MQDEKLKFDCSCHVLYSKDCKKQIQDKIALHYPPEKRAEIWMQVQQKFVDANKPIFKRLLHFSFSVASKKCQKWGEYKMKVAPYQKGQPIYYEFTTCPVAEFAKQYGLLEVMPALCNPDYTAMEQIHAKLIRKTTCSNGCRCDYTICGDRDDCAKKHPEYLDEQGYRRNR